MLLDVAAVASGGITTSNRLVRSCERSKEGKGWVQMNIPNSARRGQFNNLILFTNNIYNRCWNMTCVLILPLLFFQFKVSCCRLGPKAWLCKGLTVPQMAPSLPTDPSAHLFPGTSSQALAGLMPTSMAAVPLLHLLQHVALLWDYREKCDECRAGLSQTTALGKCCSSCMLSLGSMPKQGDKTVSDPLWTACLVEPPGVTAVTVLFFFLLVSLLLQRGGRQGELTTHSPATVITPVSSSQPYLFHAAPIPPCLQLAHFHSCFQQT